MSPTASTNQPQPHPATPSHIRNVSQLPPSNTHGHSHTYRGLQCLPQPPPPCCPVGTTARKRPAPARTCGDAARALDRRCLPDTHKLVPIVRMLAGMRRSAIYTHHVCGHVADDVLGADGQALGIPAQSTRRGKAQYERWPATRSAGSSRQAEGSHLQT